MTNLNDKIYISFIIIFITSTVAFLLLWLDERGDLPKIDFPQNSTESESFQKAFLNSLNNLLDYTNTNTEINT
jgi:hypothetical protein